MNNRRQFFSSIFGLGSKRSGSNESFSPSLPWFLEENGEKCTNCDDKPCVKSCSDSIIAVSVSGVPRLDLSRKGCTFCGDCAEACPSVCFELQDGDNRLDASVSIDILGCLAWNGTICYSCVDVCNDKAIKHFGMFHPEIDQSACTSCGFCLGVCPVQTIKIGSSTK